MFEFKKFISYRFILLGHLIVSVFIAKSLRPKAAEREVIWGEATARVPGTLVVKSLNRHGSSRALHEVKTQTSYSSQQHDY